ncbi:MAG: MBL fold metallo-hydrolase, partial [Proteobacteria bacterium]
MQISRILHAGYLFESGNTRIAFDPIFENPFSRNCYAFPAVEFDYGAIQKLKLDAIFISHYHDDHLSFESLKHLDRRVPLYLFCLHEEMFDWLRQLGFENVHPIILNRPIEVGNIVVTPRRALDAEVDSIFHIHAEGLNVLNVVDSWIDPQTLDLLMATKWDMILWPFQTMREIEVLSPTRTLDSPVQIPPESVSQLQSLNPLYIVPSSCQFIHEAWSWYNHALFPISYNRFKTEIEFAVPTTQVLRMDPSSSIQLAHGAILMAENLSWIRNVETSEVDYVLINLAVGQYTFVYYAVVAKLESAFIISAALLEG